VTGNIEARTAFGDDRDQGGSTARGKKICFLALRAYPLISPGSGAEYMGGAEKKIVVIARGLAQKGYDVSLITYAEQGTEEEYVHGVRVIKSFPKTATIGFLRKNLSLWRILRREDADVYVFSSGFLGPIGLFCLLHRKKYFYWLGSNRAADLMTIGAHTSSLEKLLLYMNIQLASTVIVQNTYQRDKINAWGKKNILVSNPIDDLPTPVDRPPERRDVIWVGQIKRIKQPLLFVDLARNFPSHRFLLIGGDEAAEKEIEGSLAAAIRDVPNLIRVGYVPHQQIFAYYLRAALLVNTSVSEGFPNTFLEAWLSGTPVVSLQVDPDGVIQRHGLGFHSESFSRMVEDVRTLLENPALRQTMGDRCRDYVLRHHTTDQAIARFEGIIHDS
jgi:glycosyltransferase involved in cell wall biosynthesis